MPACQHTKSHFPLTCEHVPLCDMTEAHTLALVSDTRLYACWWLALLVSGGEKCSESPEGQHLIKAIGEAQSRHAHMLRSLVMNCLLLCHMFKRWLMTSELLALHFC